MPATVTSRRLYEIAGDVEALEALLLEMGGEWTPEVEALFAEVEGSLEQKVDSYAALIREWELDAEKWKAEEQRVAAHRKARENAAKRLKVRLCEQMVAMGREKVEGDRFKVAVQRAAPTVEVLVAPELLPEAFRRVVPAVVEADKRALLEAAKADGGLLLVEVNGETVEAARVVDGAPYVRVR